MNIDDELKLLKALNDIKKKEDYLSESTKEGYVLEGLPEWFKHWAMANYDEDRNPAFVKYVIT
jgi:hypothetical protein